MMVPSDAAIVGGGRTVLSPPWTPIWYVSWGDGKFGSAGRIDA